MISAFNLPTPAPGETATAAAGLNTWGTLAAGGYGDGTDDTTDPKAFVNIVLFDKDHNFLDVAYAQLKGTDLYYLSASYTVKEAGYAYLYVSNEQPVQTDVYFDDVTMTYTPTNILQSSEYYPFGLQTSNSWTRDNTTNDFLYNEGSELNTTTSFYDLPFRNYDAALGRMFQVDPLSIYSHGLTPYHYAGDNPVTFSDPMGLLREVNVNGYSDAQLRAMYRNDVATEGYSGSWGDWAADCLDFGGSGGRTVVGTDGREYGVNKNGQLGYYAEKYDTDYSTQDIRPPSQGDGTLATIIVGTKFVLYQQSSTNGQDPSTAQMVNGISFGFGTFLNILDWTVKGSVAKYAKQVTEYAKDITQSAAKYSTKLAGAGLLISLGVGGYELNTTGSVSTSTQLDLFFGGLAFVPGADIATVVYAVLNIATTVATGQSIGQNIDNYYWIPIGIGLGVAPIPKH